MEKFLVTGGAGFIGSNICKRLVSQGCFVRVVDNLITGRKSNLAEVIEKIEFIQADMGDSEVAQSSMKDIDVVLHQGALPSVPVSIDNPAATHRHCVDATFKLLLAARDAGIKRFIYAASSSANGDSPTSPKVETMPVSPLSPYAVAKLAGEYYCSVFYKIFGLSRLFPRNPRLAHYNLTFLDPDETSEVDSVAGSFMMVRTEAIQRVGLLDETFFMYGEDLDWAYRMRAAGWKVFYNADVTVLHYKGESSKTSRKARYEFYRAMHIFYQKHYRATTPLWLHWLVVGGIALRGGLAMLQELIRSRQGIRAARLSLRPEASSRSDFGEFSRAVETLRPRGTTTKSAEELRDD